MPVVSCSKPEITDSADPANIGGHSYEGSTSKKKLMKCANIADVLRMIRNLCAIHAFTRILGSVIDS
jgi:hypothetical protein